MNQRQMRTKIKKKLRELDKNHEKIMKYGSVFELAKFHDQRSKLSNQLIKKKSNKQTNKVYELILNLSFCLANDELKHFNKNFGFSDFKKQLLALNNKEHIQVKFGVSDETKTYITNDYNTTYSKKEKEAISTLYFLFIEVKISYQNKKPLTKKDLNQFNIIVD